MKNHLPSELRRLVHEAVALLGEVIRQDLGSEAYDRVERVRKSMAELQKRGVKNRQTSDALEALSQNFEALSPEECRHVARAFTLMLELMNACENAYRSFRLKERKRVSKESPPKSDKLKSLTYVITAHPTEARAPQNIFIFHQIQNELTSALIEGNLGETIALRHLLQVAWRIPVIRQEAPQVKDEAQYLFSLIFREGLLLKLFKEHPTFFIHSWVGGDKDGHPGVNEKTLLESWSLSRTQLANLLADQIKSIGQTLALFPSDALKADLKDIETALGLLFKIGRDDGAQITAFTEKFRQFFRAYAQEVGADHPCFADVERIFAAFPALVIPLELRESSDVLMTAHENPDLAITGMLRTIATCTRGGDPLWYVRGFIISMTQSFEHLQAAADLQKTIFDDVPLPVIPLFEEASSLARSSEIIEDFLRSPLKKIALSRWRGRLEIMVGYSDSAKEAGSLASRLAISESLPRLEKICLAAGLTPIFFHGSGGSVDRGGGSIEDQTSWWPKTALQNYKVTVQGEMVERSFASQEIALGQLDKIESSAAHVLAASPAIRPNEHLHKFAAKVSHFYQEAVFSEKFLKVVEAATPYRNLSSLKIGSRPSKRAQGTLSIKSLRAIPWVLCWTQTRILFPMWWGVGSAWSSCSRAEQTQLRRSLRKDPLFFSYVKALGFTLAKIELEVWRLYLKNSELTPQEQAGFENLFRNELDQTRRCFRELTGEKNLLWFRPWLGESVELRSPMIHPLNVLQIIALKKKDMELFRLTVTGIASGMMTTG